MPTLDFEHRHQHYTFITYRRTDGIMFSEEITFMFVLCNTLGRCWMFSWMRGETGERLWL